MFKYIIIFSLAICLSLSTTALGDNDKKKIIIDPQYFATTDKLNCGKAENINALLFDIINEIATYLNKNEDYNVFLTNDQQTYVENNKRSEIANKYSGDILLSIAIICPKSVKEEGVEIVNSMIELENTSQNSIKSRDEFDQEDILNDINQGTLKILNEGVVLSRLIRKNITQKKLNINKEIKFEPIEILFGVNMPATLIRVPYLECISIDNVDQQLKSKVFIDRLVTAIYSGINEFWHERNNSKKDNQ